MKKLSTLFVSVLLIANLFTAVAQKQQSDLYMTRTFSAASIKSLKVTTSGGNITVNGNDSSEAVVEVYVNCNKWSNEQIKTVLDENYTIEIHVDNGKLYVVANPKGKIKNRKLQGLDISFKINVPKQIDSRLLTNGGCIQISELSGSQRFITSGGSLSVENVSGNIAGITSGGDITVTNSKDNIDLKTSGGNITAKNCDGKINIATSGGNLDLSNINGNINAATSGGNITASNINGVIKVGTSGGSMKLSDISGNLDAKTSGSSMNVTMNLVSDYIKLSNNGNINLTLPIDKCYRLKVEANKLKTSGLKNFSGDMDSKSIDGTIGDGSAEVEIKTSSQVNLSFK